MDSTRPPTTPVLPLEGQGAPETPTPTPPNAPRGRGARQTGNREPDSTRDLVFWPSIAEKVLQFYGSGVYLDTAAAASGTTEKQVRAWLRVGVRELQRLEAGGEPDPGLALLAGFARDFEIARGTAEATATERVTSAGRWDWRASAWFLERRAPKRWGAKISLLVTQELEAFLDALERRLPPEVFSQVVRAANAAASEIEASGDHGEADNEPT